MHLLINSTLTQSNEAHVSVSERGFKFGDGLFETVAIHGQKLHQWSFHMERLKAGLQAVRIDFKTNTLEQECLTLIKANNITDGLLRIYISRGQGGRGYMPDTEATPLVVIEAIPHKFAPSTAASMWVSRYEKISTKALPVQCKIAQGMQSTLAMLEAADNDCADALLLNANGHICETTCGNIFWLRGDTLFTPSLDCGALHGSTRHSLIANSLWHMEEGAYGLDSLAQADAVIITNCRVKTTPVNRLLPADKSWQSEVFAKKCYDLLMGAAQNSS